MRQMIRDAMEDRSSPEAFRFSLNCAVCGAAWINRTSRFSKAGVTPESEGKRIIFQKLYEREWEEARERSVTDAMETFNLCPICRRLVCNRCFLLGEDIDLCTDCARALRENGRTVTASADRFEQNVMNR